MRYRDSRCIYNGATITFLTNKISLHLILTDVCVIVYVTPTLLYRSFACSKISENGTELYTPTVGIFNRCTRLFGKMHCANFNVDGFATDSNVFPGCWKASLFFFSAGLATMSVTVMAALLGCCIQSIGRKSIFNLAGVAQAVAGTVYCSSREKDWYDEMMKLWH